ncbi:MAG TPA: hypothetical protein PLR20_06170 [Syntrophales bacterium]|nr:hypothetical protein [Syntrophales bacterium]HOX94048.1 hypothetical protein [Syntrophales bacterium]HPI57908.1 hypothetical protein [Syntrophales bacterium]HPN24613.1 hypothetical protein [Syntrophales bacterium]HQM28919.1 hypothetical protein [Syntrophales bacterium]
MGDLANWENIPKYFFQCQVNKMPAESLRAPPREARKGYIKKKGAENTSQPLEFNTAKLFPLMFRHNPGHAPISFVLLDSFHFSQVGQLRIEVNRKAHEAGIDYSSVAYNLDGFLIGTIL